MIEASDTPCPTLSFLPGGTVCCDAHDEGVTRAELREHFHAGTRIVHGYEFPDHTRLLRAASATGTHPDDMRGFSVGRTSLTAPARSRLRNYLREQRAATEHGNADTNAQEPRHGTQAGGIVSGDVARTEPRHEAHSEDSGHVAFPQHPLTSGLDQHGERVKVRTGAGWGDHTEDT